MNDIIKCAGTGCGDKSRCKRYTALTSDYQSWADFYKNHENCQHYLSNGLSKSQLARIAVQSDH
jgi:hypothetical protein